MNGLTNRRLFDATTFACLLSAGLMLASLSLRATAALDGKAINPESVLAVVGPDTVRVSDLDIEVAATFAAGKGRGELPNVEPEAVLHRLVQNRLLEQEGYRLGVDQSSQVRAQVKDFARLKAVKALMDSISAPPPGYKVEKAEDLLGRTNTARHFSHILVPDEATARSLKDSVAAGVPFADLARRHSKDDTAPAGGDLGWSAENAYVEEFESAARLIAPGQVSPPVKTKFGWHLIRLNEARTDTLKSPEMAQALADGKERQRRSEAVRNYVKGLREKYQIKVDEDLLKSLDYAAPDSTVKRKLESNEAVLVKLPTGKLTVKGLTRTIRFQYFHGLDGRADAAAIRDKMFDEWLTEALLSHEALMLHLDRSPDIRRKAALEERRLIREETLKSILSFEFKPDTAAVRAYYLAHRDRFVDKPRVKVKSVLLSTEAAATAFRTSLERMTAFAWLEERTPEVVKDAPPPFPIGWVDTQELGMTESTAAVGTVLGPVSLPNGFGVGQVTAVESVSPLPLSECRDQVIRALRAEKTRAVLEAALSRLEKATPINIPKEAASQVEARVDFWRSSAGKGAKS